MSIFFKQRLKQLFSSDEDCLVVEINPDRTRSKDLFMFLFVNRRNGEEKVCGTVTLERLYAVQLELALERIDPTLNIKIKGSAIRMIGHG